MSARNSVIDDYIATGASVMPVSYQPKTGLFEMSDGSSLSLKVMTRICKAAGTLSPPPSKPTKKLKATNDED